jgi:hypothetical protein
MKARYYRVYSTELDTFTPKHREFRQGLVTGFILKKELLSHKQFKEYISIQQNRRSADFPSGSLNVDTEFGVLGPASQSEHSGSQNDSAARTVRLI